MGNNIDNVRVSQKLLNDLRDTLILVWTSLTLRCYNMLKRFETETAAHEI